MLRAALASAHPARPRQDIRAALNAAARLISAAFPNAVTELSELPPPLGLGTPAEAEEDSRSPPATPVRTKLGAAPPLKALDREPHSPAAPLTPVQLVIESPRIQQSAGAGD